MNRWQPQYVNQPHDMLLKKALAHLRQLDDPKMGQWFLDTLATDLGIPIAIGDADPIENFKLMGGALVNSLKKAGDQDPTQRAR